MIEFCTRKRMAIAIVILVSLSVLTLIMEGMWSTNHKLGEVPDSGGSNESCPSGEEEIIEKCGRCGNYEEKMESVFCLKTGYKEKVKCKEGHIITRSCQLDPGIEHKKFWVFETLLFLVGLGSYGIVKLRQRKLDRLLMDKVNRQIASGN